MSEKKNPKVRLLDDADLQTRIKRIGAEGTNSKYYQHLTAEQRKRNSGK